jgi:hypothetical protein
MPANAYSAAAWYPFGEPPLFREHICHSIAAMTDMIKTEGAIIKTDEAGRVRTPAVRREQLLDEFERSGLSGQKFAELAGIKYQTFASWAQKRRRARGLAGPVSSKPGEATRWLEAVRSQFTPANAGALGGIGGRLA